MESDTGSRITDATAAAEAVRRPPRDLSPAIAATAPGQLRVIKRNGAVVVYDDDKIQIALTKAFLAVEGGTAAASSRIRELVASLSGVVTATFHRRLPSGGTIHIEDIQDQVELALMRSGQHKVARDYVLYREERARVRAAKTTDDIAPLPEIHITDADGERRPLPLARIRTLADEACAGLDDVTPGRIIEEALANMYDGISAADVATSLIMTARTLVEEEPNYTHAAARLLLDRLRSEALSFLGVREQATQAEMTEVYPRALAAFVDRGIELELLAPELKRFDIERLGAALKPERDLEFTYLGLQTLYDRYFIHWQDTRFELPQVFFMRVAMGLATQEDDREARAIEFYNLLSSFNYLSSTPTLFNAGTLRSQLSSCYLTTVSDDLDGIYSAIRDNALLSKWAGGLGNDWTPVRALGAYIKGTNGKSQGVVPFLKVVNDTAVAVNQCFAPDTRIHTADGIKAIRDVTTDDLVLGRRGEYRQVLKTMTYNQTDAMVKVDVKHAAAPLCVTAGHPVWAIQGVPNGQSVDRTLGWLAKGKVRPAWVEAGELREGDYVAQAIPQEVVPVAGLDDDAARLYGILLGGGYCSEDGSEWSVGGNQDAGHIAFVQSYLEGRGVHFWMTDRGSRECRIRWADGIGLKRDGTTGRYPAAGRQTLPFGREDIYDRDGNKRIARRFAHLPEAQTLSLIEGLLQTAGKVRRGKEIIFASESEALAEGVRYQMLRQGVPTAGTSPRRAHEVHIPAVRAIACRMNCQVLTKRDWVPLGNWVFSPVRGTGAMTPTPFVCDLKVEGDESYMTTVALAHNGGKRKGAVCAYIETWHLDIEEFLELRKNTGDDRRRTHDMNTANWVPDLFMKRVFEDGDWTLFSPSDVPDLHDLYGAAFEARYSAYEKMAEEGEIKLHKKVRAQALWRKMLSMLFETGHPWLTFKDPCNIRSPQQHAGVVHSSNLCTEITLNTAGDEIAVCNLGSVNLARHIEDGKLDDRKLRKTVRTAVRMLDNVIDINYYAVPQARKSNMLHRPVGLGIMGFQDALYKL
ncbi:MAG: ribonucleoside-diphosphate reductase subunit alpha, partial [Gammaproteobacteria bacterium]|nr:ribonucleoside-diphosphate reductase subunit alpha [Gammaproteobacteria bacterium]